MLKRYRQLNTRSLLLNEISHQKSQDKRSMWFLCVAFKQHTEVVIAPDQNIHLAKRVAHLSTINSCALKIKILLNQVLTFFCRYLSKIYCGFLDFAVNFTNVSHYFYKITW